MPKRRAEWRTQRETVRDILDGHLLPQFGNQPLSLIDKGAILAFRAQVTQLPGRSKADLRLAGESHHDAAANDADRCGRPLRFYLSLAQYSGAQNPRTTTIMPFSLDEIGDIVDNGAGRIIALTTSPVFHRFAF